MCPACANKALHGPADWLHHPYAHHGYNGSTWTHPDLDPGAHTGRTDNLNSAVIPNAQ